MAAVRGRGARGHTSVIYLLLYLGKIHQMVMFAMLKKFRSGFLRNRRATAMLLVPLAASTVMFAAAPTVEKPAAHNFYEPLPQETGAAGLNLMLRRLSLDAGHGASR